MPEKMTRTGKTRSPNRQFWIYLEGWVSIGLNLLLFIAKYWVGMITGSVAMMADAWHTMSDSLSSIVVLVGARFSFKKADAEHPFGHGRAELVASIIIGVLLAMVAFNFLVESVSKLIHQESASFSILAVIVFAVSTVLKEGMAQFSIRAGRKLDSRSLIADGWHHRSDAIASILIVAGIFAGKYLWWIDSILGIAVALLIFYATFDILRQSISPLIGEKPGNEVIQAIHRLAVSIIDKPYDIHHIHIHRYGENIELTFHLQLLFPVSFEAAHDLVTRLEQALREQLRMEATIHYEPDKKGKMGEDGEDGVKP